MQVDPTTAALLQSTVHELKGPASRVRLLVQLLARNSSAWDEDSKTILKHLQDSAAAIGAVGEALKQYSEICARPPRREIVDLSEALAEARSGIEAEAASAGARIEASALPAMDGDRTMIVWLLRELLTNAIRFRGDAAPKIQVSAGPGYICICDNGPGIDADFAERVFRPFKKLSGDGAGLGLTICRRIAELHGERLWVEPRTGGADIRFSVPAAVAGNGDRV